MAIILTERLVTQLKPRDKVYEVADGLIQGFLVRIQPSGLKAYYYRYRAVSGKRQRINLGACSVVPLASARTRVQILAGQVAAGQDPLIVQQQDKARQRKEQLSTLGAFLEEEYQPWFMAHRKGGMQVILQTRRIFAFLLATPMTEINSLAIDRWRTQKHQQGTKKETLNRYLTLLRSCLNKAVEWGFIEKNPLQYMRAYKVDSSKHVERYLSAEEEMNLRFALDEREKQLREERQRYNAWNAERGLRQFPDLNLCAYADHLKPVVLLAMNTGLRKGELLSLTWHNINFETRQLTVRGELAKSGQTRHIPLNDEALTILQKWKMQQANSYWVFSGKNGQPIKDIKTAWASVLRRARITHFRFHDLRHHFASQLVMAEVDLNTVRQLLGHSDYSSTLRYAHLAPCFLADAVAKLKPRQWGDCNSVAFMRS